MKWGILVVAAVTAAAPVASAQNSDVAASAPTATVADSIEIPAGTIVEIELTEALSSRTSQIGQTFGIRLTQPIVVDGVAVVPAGAQGGGEVIDAHASAFGGRQGRLIISGRFVEINGAQARIRGMQITAAGENNAIGALAVSMIPYAGIAGIFVQGGEVEIPAGARGTARLTAGVVVPTPARIEQSPAEAGTSPSEGSEHHEN